MAYYRLPHLDLSTLIHLAMQMLDPSRPWGLVTDLASEYQVSRKFLYQQGDRAEAGLLSALAAVSPGPKPASYMLTSAQQARETLETALSLLQELGDANISSYASKLLKHQDELLTPLVWLEQQMASHRQGLDSSMEASIIWAYKHHGELGLECPGRGFPSELCPVVEAFWQALDTFHPPAYAGVESESDYGVRDSDHDSSGSIRETC
jgi:hypothetical protein